MALKVDLRHFLDENGNVLDLAEQAKVVFSFLTSIVLFISKESQCLNTEQLFIDVDLKCNTRADKLSCKGHIEARYSSITTSSPIEWQCDTCEAAGTILNWQGSLWDMQKRTMH